MKPVTTTPLFNAFFFLLSDDPSMDPADSSTASTVAYSIDSRSIQSLMQAERKLLDPKSGQLHTAVDISCQNVIPAALKGAHQRYVEQGLQLKTKIVS